MCATTAFAICGLSRQPPHLLMVKSRTVRWLPARASRLRFCRDAVPCAQLIRCRSGAPEGYAGDRYLEDGRQLPSLTQLGRVSVLVLMHDP